MSQTRLTNVRNLMLLARWQVAQPVNVALTMVFSKTGGCIRQDILEKKGQPTARRFCMRCRSGMTFFHEFNCQRNKIVVLRESVHHRRHAADTGGSVEVMSKDLVTIDSPDSSKSQFLVFEAENGQVKIDVRLEDETVWLTQQLMADLFQTTKQNIGQHLKNIFLEDELFENSVVKKFFATSTDGKLR